MTRTEQTFDLARKRLCDAAVEWAAARDSDPRFDHLPMVHFSDALETAVGAYTIAFDALEAEQRAKAAREREVL